MFTASRILTGTESNRRGCNLRAVRRQAGRYSSRVPSRARFPSRRETLCATRQGAPHYSILTCTQAFAGKSVPVITLMNGNKGRRRALRRAILCSPCGVLRAVLSPSRPPSPTRPPPLPPLDASLLSHSLSLSLFLSRILALSSSSRALSISGTSRH